MKAGGLSNSTRPVTARAKTFVSANARLPELTPLRVTALARSNKLVFDMLAQP